MNAKKTKTVVIRQVLLDAIVIETLRTVHLSCQTILADHPEGLRIYSELLQVLAVSALSVSKGAEQAYAEQQAAERAAVAKAKAEAEVALAKAAQR